MFLEQAFKLINLWALTNIAGHQHFVDGLKHIIADENFKQWYWVAAHDLVISIYGN